MRKNNKIIKIILFFCLIFIIVLNSFVKITYAEYAAPEGGTESSSNSDDQKENLEYPEYTYNSKNLPDDKKELENILEACEERKGVLQYKINQLPDTSQTKENLKQDLNKVNLLMQNIKNKIKEIEEAENANNQQEETEEEKKKMEEFKPDYWEPKSTTEVQGASKLENVGNKIIGFIRMLASIVSVLVLIILGIKYTMGSVEEKAAYKNTMLPYLIGAILIFGITNILAIVEKITTDILN